MDMEKLSLPPAMILRIISRVGVHGSQGSRSQAGRNVVSFAITFVLLAAWAWLVMVGVKGDGFPSVAQRAYLAELLKSVR